MSSTERPPMSPRNIRIAVGIAFVLLTVVDLWTYRLLWRAFRPAPATVSKAVFEFTDGREIAPRAVPFAYFMLPQPYFPTKDALVVPPGHPFLAHLSTEKNRSLVLDVYEDRTPPLVQVQPGGKGTFLTLVAGATREGSTMPMTDTPPPRAALDGLLYCFAADEPIRFVFDQTDNMLAISAGACRWSFSSTRSEVLLDAFGSSSRIELKDERAAAERIWRLWVLLLALMGSLISRLPLCRARWIGTDAAATLTVWVASAISPLWVVLYAIKACLGLGVGAYEVFVRVRHSVAWRVGTATVVGAAIAGALMFDPHALLELNTAFNAQGMGDEGSANMRLRELSAVRPSDDTTHLVLGYSNANGQALAHGAYGSGATDQVLQRTCGASRKFARNAIDGGNACVLAPRWSALAASLPALKERIYFGGFNDDLTPPTDRLAVWLGTVVGVIPSTDPFPKPMKLWADAARANLEPRRAEELLTCLRQVATGARAPFVHVYDLGVFDLGGPRRWGRENWESTRRRVVEELGGTYVDQRTLLPGESPVYFNDMSHLSEVGYAALASSLCALLEGPLGVGGSVETP